MKPKHQVEELIVGTYFGFASSNENFRQTLNEIGTISERIINTGQSYVTVMSAISSLTVRSFAITTMALDFCTVFDVLNERLKDEIESLQNLENDMLFPITREESREFKNDVFNTIERDMMKKLKVVINQNFVAPILKFVITKGIDKASTAFEDLMPGVKSNDEKSKNIAKNLNSQNEEKMDYCPSDTDNFKNDTSKMEEIKANTTLTRLISEYAMYATPLLGLCGTDMEAIARKVLKSIEVNYEGVRYVFGRSSDVYKINAESSSTTTDKLRQLSIESIYQHLKDDIKTDLPEFQKDVAIILQTDRDLINLTLQNNQKKQFGTLGFYAGKFFFLFSLVK